MDNLMKTGASFMYFVVRYIRRKPRKHDPEKLKWWYWKDKKYRKREEKEGYV